MNGRSFSVKELIALGASAITIGLIAILVVLDTDISRAERRLLTQAKTIHAAVSHRLDSLQAVLLVLVELQHAGDMLKHAQFTAFAQELLTTYPHIRSILFLNKTSQAASPTARPFYLPINLIESLEPLPEHLLGYDAASHPVLKQAIEDAVASGAVIASPPIRLRRDRDSILVLKSTYRGPQAAQSSSDRQALFSGMIALELEAEHLLHGLLTGDADLGISIRIIDQQDSAGSFYQRPADKQTVTDTFPWFPRFSYQQPLDIYGQTLSLTISQQPGLDIIQGWSLSTALFLSVLLMLSLVWIYRNTLERQQAKEALRLAATTFETHEGIVITDSKGKILRVNRAFTRITGYMAEEIIGENARRLQSGRQDAAFYRHLWDTVLATGYWQGEIWNRRKNGEIYPEWLSITAVKDDYKVTSHYVGAFIDLSELKRQQQIIERTAQEEQALGTLLRLSHQLLDMETFLQQALEALLTSVAWLGILPKGAILLNAGDGQGEVLQLTATHGLPPDLRKACRRVPFGKCLCGRAAATRSVHFTAHVDHQHEIRYDGMVDHGHYNVPILSGETVLGVLVIYLPPEHPCEEQEKAFLCRVADVLGMGISRRQVEAKIKHQAYHDVLTDLPNRSLLLDRMEQALANAKRHRHLGALLFLDLDHFKNINDSLGHLVGDELLREVAGRLRAGLREADTVARLGGDEFVVLSSEVYDKRDMAVAHAQSVAKKLLTLLATPFPIQGDELHVTASIGIVLFPQDHKHAADILKHADTAMYQAKRIGRNNYRFFSPVMQHAAEKRLSLQNELRQALRRNELHLYFQPQVNADGEINGAETLLRWAHPQRGITSPTEFIPAAEETDLILSIGEWVLRNACARIVTWGKAGISVKEQHLAINVSPRQFHQTDFVDQIKRICIETGCDPSLLELELTEGVLLADVEDAIKKMQALKALGIRFSIDDFGTGYSSLAYLKRLPLDKLKIDRSFVRDIVTDPNDAAIADTIIAIAHHLELEVIAEGVESIEQFDFLRARSCTGYQGYYFSRPLTLDDYLRRLSTDRP